MTLHCWLILKLHCTMTERQHIITALDVREQLDICISEEEISPVPMTNGKIRRFKSQLKNHPNTFVVRLSLGF